MTARLKFPIQCPPGFWRKAMRPILAKFLEWLKDNGAIVEEDFHSNSWWVHFYPANGDSSGECKKCIVILRCQPRGWIGNIGTRLEYHPILVQRNLSFVEAAQDLIKELKDLDPSWERKVDSILDRDRKPIFSQVGEAISDAMSKAKV